MKTAISIEDHLFDQAEQTAHRLGLSRSKLYSLAIQEFVQLHDPEAITSKLNSIFMNERFNLDDDLNLAQYELFSKEEW